MVAAGFPHNLSFCLPAQHTKEKAAIAGLGGPAATRETEDPLMPVGTDSAIPTPMATLAQTSP